MNMLSLLITKKGILIYTFKPLLSGIHIDKQSYLEYDHATIADVYKWLLAAAPTYLLWKIVRSDYLPLINSQQQHPQNN